MIPLTYFLLTAAVLLTTTGGSAYAGWALFGVAALVQGAPAILSSLPVDIRRHPAAAIRGANVADYIPGDVPEPIIQRAQQTDTAHRLQEESPPGIGDTTLPEDTRITPIT